MMLRRTLPALALLASAHSLGYSATNSPANLYDAPDVIVTATRTARNTATIAAPITVITAAELRSRGTRFVVDALRDLAGLQVRSLNANPAQAELVLRGFGENGHGRTLVLRDGQRLNSPDMAGINWLQLPVSAIERIEILEGNQTTLYGDYAVGGVVNVITREAAEESASEVTAHAASHGTYGASLNTRQQLDEVTASAGLDWQTSDGYRRNGDYDTFNLRAGVETPLTSTLHLSLLGSYNNLESGLPGYLTRDAMRADPRQTITPDDKAETDNYNANLMLRWLATPEQELNANLIYNRRETLSKYFSSISFTDTDLDSLTFTINHRLDGLLLGREARLLSGFDLYFDRLKADRFGESDLQSRLLDATIDKESYGLYLIGESDLHEKLVLSLGGRIEAARYSATVNDASRTRLVDDHKTHTVEAFNASLIFRPDASAKLYANFSTLYRLPFLDEQVSYYGYGSDALYDDLDPERGLAGDLGIEWRFMHCWQAQLSAYLIAMRDEITYNPVTSRNDNLDRTRHQGVSSAITWHEAGRGKLRARYDFTDATFRSGAYDGNDVPLVPRHRFSLAGEADLPFDLALLATLNLCGNQPLGGDYANSSESLDSYTTVDLALRWQSQRHPTLSLLAGVDNLFDKSYANMGYLGFMTQGYYPAAGRTFKATLSCLF